MLEERRQGHENRGAHAITGLNRHIYINATRLTSDSFSDYKVSYAKTGKSPNNCSNKIKTIQAAFPPTFACSGGLIRVRHTTSFVYIFLKTIISQRAAILRGGIRSKIASCLRRARREDVVAMTTFFLLTDVLWRTLTSDRFYGSGRCHHCQCLLQPDNSSPTTKTNPSQFDFCVGFGRILLKSQTDVFVLEVIMYAHNNKKLIHSIRRRSSSFDISSNKSVSVCFTQHTHVPAIKPGISVSISPFRIFIRCLSKKSLFENRKFEELQKCLGRRNLGISIGKVSGTRLSRNWKQIHFQWQMRVRTVDRWGGGTYKY